MADDAVKVHEGAGCVDDFGVERFCRDAKATRVYEGTTETEKDSVARELRDKGTG